MVLILVENVWIAPTEKSRIIVLKNKIKNHNIHPCSVSTFTKIGIILRLA